MKKPSSLAWFATFAATAMIANHIAGKATRDAIFLTHFDVTDIPMMLMVTSVLSIISVILMTRLLSTWGPKTIVPIAFFISGALFLLERVLLGTQPKMGSVILYLHIAVFGAVLISGFWSVVNELFDPRTAKIHIGKIAGGTTSGGLLGGIIAERIAAHGDSLLMIPILAGLHFFAGFVLLVNRSSEPSRKTEKAKVQTETGGYLAVFKSRYLTKMALMVLLITTGGAILDYILKFYAKTTYTTGDDLLRFFATFYTGLGLATLLFQAGFTKWVLRKFGNIFAVGTVPIALTFGGVGVFTFPSLLAIVAAKGLEGVFRNSVYRSGYELLYNPVATNLKRRGKMLIDVGVDRFADAVAGGLITLLLLFFNRETVNAPLLILSAILGAAAFLISRMLRKGYVRHLEKSLVNQAEDMEITMSLGNVAETFGDANLNISQFIDVSQFAQTLVQPQPQLVNHKTQPELVVNSGPVNQLKKLVSRDPLLFRQCLAELQRDECDPILLPQIINSLAWDEVIEDINSFFEKIKPRIEGQLSDRLLDPDEDFVIRRRIPRLLLHYPSQQTCFGLTQGLKDKRFEVRFQCGVALLSLSRTGTVACKPDAETITSVILLELKVDSKIWKNQKLLDKIDFNFDESASEDISGILEARTSRSVQHIFNLLALVYPEEPLRIAYRGLATEDPMLNGTALEYLESVLPPNLRTALWPYLDQSLTQKRQSDSLKSKDAAYQDLMNMNESIALNLESINKRLKKGA